MMQLSLYQYIVNKRYCTEKRDYIEGDLYLNDQDKTEIYDILSYRCRKDTRQRLKNMISYVDCKYWFKGGLTENLIKHHERWQYVAGQDYPGEVRELRNKLLNYY